MCHGKFQWYKLHPSRCSDFRSQQLGQIQLSWPQSTLVRQGGITARIALGWYRFQAKLGIPSSRHGLVLVGLESKVVKTSLGVRSSWWWCHKVTLICIFWQWNSPKRIKRTKGTHSHQWNCFLEWEATYLRSLSNFIPKTRLIPNKMNVCTVQPHLRCVLKWRLVRIRWKLYINTATSQPLIRWCLCLTTAFVAASLQPHFFWTVGAGCEIESSTRQQTVMTSIST